MAVFLQVFIGALFTDAFDLALLRFAGGRTSRIVNSLGGRPTMFG